MGRGGWVCGRGPGVSDGSAGAGAGCMVEEQRDWGRASEVFTLNRVSPERQQQQQRSDMESDPSDQLKVRRTEDKGRGERGRETRGGRGGEGGGGWRWRWPPDGGRPRSPTRSLMLKGGHRVHDRSVGTVDDGAGSGCSSPSSSINPSPHSLVPCPSPLPTPIALPPPPSPCSPPHPHPPCRIACLISCYVILETEVLTVT